jgi:UDP-N-acetylglucosamine--N-acetylmuramyl-(pentapeptide) pyrophosphoryl-undecaprenol N-acetylglucosamine transferase
LTGSGLYDPSRGAIRRVAVVLGRGGVGIDASALNQAACETPDVAWHVYGPLRPTDATAPNLRIYGWQADIRQPLDDADAVIGGAGDGLLAEVVTRGKRFICLPEPRPFDEQGAKARVLADHDMAVVLDAWPVSSAWPAIFRQAEALDPVKLHALADPHAIADLAKALDGLAASVKKDA